MLDFTKPLIYVDSMKNEYPARFITRINNNNLPNVIVFTRKDGLEAIHMCTDEGSLSRYGQQKIFQAPAPKVSKWVRHFINKDTGSLGFRVFITPKGRPLMRHWESM